MIVALGIALAALIILFIAFWKFAHRDPERDVVAFDGYLSPADGIVVAVHDVRGKNKQFIKKKAHGITAWTDDFPQAETIVVIMMKFWHVHTQRAMADGVTVRIGHQDGKFSNAVWGEYHKATVENEHGVMTFGGKRPSKVYLIAGFVARRIHLWVKPKQKVKQGERISNITFGSQVAVVLPKAQLLVKEGDRVYAGLTPIAK